MDGTPFGRYRLVDLLGRGGMGEVWRAFDTAIDRVVALKVLPETYADDPVFQERFRREARAAASLEEPHVVPIHDFGEIDGRLYVTMRLINGQDLQTLLQGGPLTPTRAVGIIEQIASALHAAHRVGLVHRDVKPSNILVAEDDFAYLIDFGIARAAGDVGLTSTGATVGTWAYMSPERLDTGDVDARADIYALACVLHESLTGQRPYPGSSLEQQIVGHLTKPPPRPSVLRSGLPGGLDTVVATGMAKKPEQRYSTTKDLARAARDAITDPLPQRRPTPPPSTVARPTEPVAPASKPTQAAPDRPPAPAVRFAPAPSQRRPPDITPPPRPPQPSAAFHTPPPRQPERNSKRPIVLAWSAAAAALVAIVVVIVAIVSNKPAAPTDTVSQTSTTTTSTSRPPTSTTTSFASTPTPTAVGGWGVLDPTATAFQGLVPATPDGKGYLGATCSTSTSTVFHGIGQIACRGDSLGCSFEIEAYPPGDDVLQHFYDLGPAVRGSTPEPWRRGNQTGSLRYGTNGPYQQLNAVFDDPARRHALLYVQCENVKPFEAWWPNAPL